MPTIAAQLAALQTGDVRRNRRVVWLARQMAMQPGSSVPQMFGNHADVQAAYRLLQSEDVAPEAILAAQREACLQRLQGGDTLLAIQDTTYFTFSHHPATAGQGPLQKASLTGFLAHTTFAVSGDGVPLGVLQQKHWVRGPQVGSDRNSCRQRAFEDKESFRWVEALRALHELPLSDYTVFTVADREADIYELFVEPRPEWSHLLVRACHDRALADDERHLWDAVRAAPVSGTLKVTLRRHPTRRERHAKLTVRTCRVTLQPPGYRVEGQPLAPVEVSAILVTEPNPPKGQTRIQWLLLTTIEVPDFETAEHLVHYYACRWLVERFHYVLKSGCRFEQSQLRTVRRLQRLLALYCVVAWRLLWLTYMARLYGDQPCTIALEILEWQALHRVKRPATPLPDTPPTLSEALRWVASLGGHLGRKGDGEPGVKVLWRGLVRLQDIVTGFIAARDQDPCNA
jgi:Transposase DNA-binding/Transposase Tn5 dimerisation domain